MKKDENINDQNNDDRIHVNENLSEEEIKDSTVKDESNSTNTDELEKKIKQLETELADSKDKLLRTAAEFQNFKRRTEVNQLNLIKYDGESFITNLLTVIDDFERSIQHFESARDVVPLKDGIKLVYEKFMKILTEQGIHKIQAIGKPFDVHLHEAILQRKADGVEPHTVLDEIEKGYLYKDKVIRHSKVIVSEDISEKETAESNDQTENKSTGE
jgi:molecular chaperone GrpE